MTLDEKMESIEDALHARAITLKQAALLFYDAFAHDTYCETDGAGAWAAWVGNRKDAVTGTLGVRVLLPATDAALFGEQKASA